jgi:hypothetical protein
MNTDDPLRLSDFRHGRYVASAITRADAERHFDFSLALVVIALVVAVGMTMATFPARAGDRISIAFDVESASQIERMAQAIRALVQKQIEAVRQANAAAAYDAVAPSLKRHFNTGEKYLRSVKAQVPSLADGHVIAFGDLRKTSFGLAQAVRISDARGEPWFAIFLIDQESGHWRIRNIIAVKMPFARA